MNHLWQAKHIWSEQSRLAGLECIDFEVFDKCKEENKMLYISAHMKSLIEIEN